MVYSLALSLPVGSMLLAERGGDRLCSFGFPLPVPDVLVAVSGKPPELARGPPEYRKRCNGGTGHYPGENHEELHLRPSRTHAVAGGLPRRSRTDCSSDLPSS
jgi:hypothetical protein